MGMLNDVLEIQHRRASPEFKALRRDLARFFRRLTPADRCLLIAEIERARERYHRLQVKKFNAGVAGRGDA